ncbi:YihY/virulence factor BrkB family protein [Sinomonas mesophila]|uniref:YihY/virulence factor BrkB family protein n=1 Tax=Sinomonas mesophila TaxID=1531955 RepID=UPI003183AD3F
MAQQRTKTANGRTPAEQPLPTERAKLRLEVLRRRQDVGKARRNREGTVKVTLAMVQWLVARLKAFRPVRVFQHYTLAHGPLMSAGIGFTMFFSVFGLLATGFSLAALVLAGQPALVDRVVASVAAAAPGLLRVDGSEGLVDPDDLLNPTGLGVAAIIAVVVTVFSSLGWITGLRDGLRGVVGLPPLTVNPVLLKLRDIGTLLLLGVLIVVTSAVSIVFTAALDFIAGNFGLDGALMRPVGWLVGLAVPLALNTVTAVIMFRLAGGLTLGRRAFIEGAVLAGVGTSLLQAFSTQLLARAGANPLLAPFAIIIGLLIWFNLVSQVYLLAAAWSTVRQADLSAAGHHAAEAFGSARVGLHASPALIRARQHAVHGPAPAPAARNADDGERRHPAGGRRRALHPVQWLRGLRKGGGEAPVR